MKKRADDREKIDERRASSPAPSMPLPNERDASNDQRESSPRRLIKRAHDDLADGLVDTDQHGTEAARAFAGASEGSARKRGPRAAKRKRVGP